MKADYWNVTDAQVQEKTGKKLADWISVLKDFNAGEKKSAEVVDHLQQQYGVPRYWARTLTTHYQKMQDGE